MFRLISILLLLAGIALAAFGALRMTGGELPIYKIAGDPAPAPSPELAAVPERVTITPQQAPPPEPVRAIAPEPVLEPVLETEPVPAPISEPAPQAKQMAPKNDTSAQRTTTRSLSVPDAETPPSEPAPQIAEPAPVVAPPEPMLQAERVVTPAPPEPSFIDQLREVPIAHETPAQATFGRPFTVTMAINSMEGAESATSALPGTGNVVEAEAKVSDTVRAIVAGEAFTVDAVNPETQKLSPLTENVWRWSVTPLKAGPQELVIEIYAIDDDEALPVRTFRDTVTVEVSRFGQAIAMAQQANPLIMVLAGIGSIFAGLFGAARFFRGR